MHSGKAILSHPFNDPYGRGQVISISKAVLKNRYTFSMVLTRYGNNSNVLCMDELLSFMITFQGETSPWQQKELENLDHRGGWYGHDAQFFQKAGNECGKFTYVLKFEWKTKIDGLHFVFWYRFHRCLVAQTSTIASLWTKVG